MSDGPELNELRLLIVATYPPPYGGIATHLTKLIPGLHQQGAADICVVSFSDHDVSEQRDGFTLYRFNVTDHISRIAHPRNWRVAANVMATMTPHGFSPRMQLRETVKALLIDLVARSHDSNVVSFYHCNMSMQLPGLARLWKQRRSTVLTVFGEIYETSSRSLIRDHAAFFRGLFDVPAAIASSSRHCAGAYAEIGVKRHIEPVYYGVDLSGPGSVAPGRRWREGHGVSAQDVVVLFMGRLSREMGVDVAVTAAPSILREDASIRIVLAGAPGDESEATHALANEHPGRVIIEENVSFAEQGVLYDAADMLVAPTFNQRACMGMAIKEGMAAGLPVVAGAGGGVPEAVVDRETGLLIPLDANGAVDARLFADAVVRLANDASLRERLGGAGRRRAEELFAHERTNRRMAEMFRAALAARA
jgi:glycosyltransferase involved in cell wall biosynthesis